jgi:hypothetical protein
MIYDIQRRKSKTADSCFGPVGPPNSAYPQNAELRRNIKMQMQTSDKVA